MPPRHAQLKIDRTFTSRELDLLRAGLRPATMDHRWTSQVEGDWIHFHRSWTGHCIYSVKLESGGTGARVSEVIANRDPSQYAETDDDRDARWLLWMIERLVLGLDVPSPAHEEQRDRGEGPAPIS